MNDKMILLVEDNPDDELLTLRAFKKSRVVNDIVVARDGEEALDFLFGRGKYIERDLNLQPQLILLDLKLPKLDGLEVLKAIRENERTRLTPVVILTSSKERQDLMRGYSLGVNSYIQKPVDFNQFLTAVEQLGLYWLVLNQTPH